MYTDLCTVASRLANNLERRSELRKSVGSCYGLILIISPECESICEPRNCPQEGIHVSQPLPSHPGASSEGPCGSRNGD